MCETQPKPKSNKLYVALRIGRPSAYAYGRIRKEERSSADKRFLFTSLSFLLLGRDIGLQF